MTTPQTLQGEGVSEIPEDIRKAAQELYSGLHTNNYSADCDDRERAEDVDAIAYTILAERERCAQIADEEAGWGTGCNPVMLGRRIADRIRGEA